MSEAVYERYKDALRRGHVAALRGRLDDALAAYAEAASIAPERPLPYSSMGGVQLRLGRLDDALASYDAALDRAPSDESALLGRAEALSGAGRRVQAAEALDLASEAQAAAGRPLDALDSARRSLELAESRARRRHVRRLIDEVSAGEVDGAAEDAIARAAAVLEAAERLPATARDGGEAGPESVVPEGSPATVEGEAAPGGEAAATPATPSAPSPVTPAGEPGAPTAGAAVPLGPAHALAADPLELALAADLAIAAGDRLAARDALLAAAAGDAAAGLTDSALDACYRALAVAPGDPDLHLALVDLYVARGWTALAARKLALLERLVTLDGDEAASERVRARAASAFLDAGRPGEVPSVRA